MIVIVDYGMGNLRSVQKGFETVGHAATISADPAAVRGASKLVLPGVGAFPDAIDELRRRDLIEPIREYAAADRPFLGICLGLQLLFETGTEGGRHEGLGILAGEVVKFDVPRQFKVPHMGWNKLEIRRPCALTANLSSEPFVYFVHSYYAAPRDPEIVAAECVYHRPIAAMVRRGNLYACQFHPEKSQRDGLEILRSFAALK
jgi:imidazole glycerol-phosphate synthase subunit HisH